MTIFRSGVATLLVVCSVFLWPLCAEEDVSSYWKTFRDASDRAPTGILSDFSYAGYERGEKPIPDIRAPIFRVTDFGAVPDDGRSDEAAIRAALEAAQKAGGGVILFPPGRFDVWMAREGVRPILISSSNIVLRGAGSSKGGTVIRVHHSALKPDRYRVEGADLNNIPYLFMFQKSGPEKSVSTGVSKTARLKGDAARASLRLPVASTEGFKPGDWIQIKAKSVDFNSQLLAGLKPEAGWTRIREGLSICESHQVAAVADNSLVLRQPILLNIPETAEARITVSAPLENVGVEDLAIQGSWRTPFFHHRGMLDDEGWDGILFDGVANGWVRRCAFLNMNSGIYLKGSVQCSLLENRFSGTPGHYNAASRSDSSFNLMGLSQDSAGQLHAASTGNRSAGTTVWRWKLMPGQSIDSHGNGPYATLIDRVDGGTMTVSGGPEAAYPNHLRWMVYWNFAVSGTVRNEPVAFWGGKPCFVMPLFVGLHGQRMSLVGATLEGNEYQGSSVQPESLYEAQLELRLGGLPGWIGQSRKEWEDLQRQELPPHDERPEEVSFGGQTQVDFSPEEFPLNALLDDLGKLFSQQGLGWKRDLKIENRETGITLFTDYVQLRSILHSMGIYASEGLPIVMNIRSDKNGTVFSMPVTSSAAYRKSNASYLASAGVLSRECGARLEDRGGMLTLTLQPGADPRKR